MSSLRLIIMILLTTALGACGDSESEAPALFNVTLNADGIDEPVDGRVIIAISKTQDFELRNVAKSSQVFGMTVDGIEQGGSIDMRPETFGYPYRSAADIPPGDYFAKAILHRYETFKRADGAVLKLPMDRGEGQNWREAPGNLYSDVVPVKVSQDGFVTAQLSLSNVMEGPGPPAETKWVKNFDMVSDRVSQFWGREMKIGARVLLPKGYEDNPGMRYPVVIEHGHFSTRAPGRFEEPKDDEEPSDFYKFWTSDDSPRFLLITVQHATPYYDDSYAVNSANHGPYGDAITYELLPAVEAAFRGIGKPEARFLTGGSTGGWESFAVQVFYPDQYGGTWSFYPDQVDFHYYQLADLYDAPNAYYRIFDWLRTPIPGARDTDGRPRYMMSDENHFEEVVGTRSRSGGQWAAWNATYAPVGEDGYPMALWDPITGDINRAAADYAIENYDITKYLRDNWAELGPKLEGKLNVFMGRRDNFYLEQATYKLEDFLRTTTQPAYKGRFEYGEKGRHGWNPWRDSGNPGGLYEEMIDTLESKPEDTPPAPETLTN